MFKVFRTEEFEREIEKFLTSKEHLRLNKIEKELSEKGFTGKPSGYDLFREKRINGRRVYFLIYTDLKLVLLVSVSDKKKQQRTITEVKGALIELKRVAEEKAKLILLFLFFLL